MLASFLLTPFLYALALADPEHPRLEKRAAKNATVTIPTATVIGIVKDGVESFGGIPWGKAPTGNLRLRPPQRITENIGVFDATGPAGACPQQVGQIDGDNFIQDLIGNIANLPFIQKATGQSEDCLSITVARPEGTTEKDKLPVLYWIFGGGFQLGWSSMYDGSGLVQYGVQIGRPFIFVAINYRVNGFGFLPGKEVVEDGAANLGLLDQRMGLEWVADNIGLFGGDADKVTIWGESAGAISVYDQLALYGGNHVYAKTGKPLFRGAIMSSGSVIPTERADSAKAQKVYDRVVEAAGCAGAADTLQCLREVDYKTFLDAVSSAPSLLSYNSIALSYLPRPDGNSLPDSPEVLLAAGKYAPVPMIAGGMEDEGTLFALFQPNLTTTAGLVQYLKTLYFQSASEAKLTELVNTYGNGLAAVNDGSPFRTGLLNEIFPGFKRRAALLGDLAFTLTRRGFLDIGSTINPDVPSWSFMGSFNYGTLIMGTFHASDLIQVFFGIKDNYAARSFRTYFFNFLYDLDPNSGAQGKYPNWPKWKDAKQQMQFFADKSGLIKDDYRSATYKWLQENIALLHL